MRSGMSALGGPNHGLRRPTLGQHDHIQNSTSHYPPEFSGPAMGRKGIRLFHADEAPYAKNLSASSPKNQAPPHIPNLSQAMQQTFDFCIQKSE